MVNFIETYVFYFKQYSSNIISLSSIDFNLASFFVVFLFGILTSLNPCSLSIIPLYVSYIADNKTKNKQELNISFIIGILLNFLTISSLIIYFSNLYKVFLNNIDILLILNFVIIGLSLLKIISWENQFIFNRRFFVKFQYMLTPTVKFLILGFGSSFITSSCNLPIFVSFIVWLTVFQRPINIILFFITYFIGYSTCLIISIIISRVIKKISVYQVILSWCTAFVGCATLSNGIFLLCNYVNL
uniref:Cytochrome c biogenesis protein transmembrane region n=1 Tax=Rhodochaete parvula TaxID=110510 RepID=A0A1X9PUV1_9RHOD|nr:thiol:disulfide interchange protein [Rhodochaete parvula]ASK39634.1 cytochrome c biogenesis protein transmembrane region [Rhodochaete parvula]